MSRRSAQPHIAVCFKCNNPAIEDQCCGVHSTGAVVQWQSIGLVTERLRVRLTPGPLQATLSKLVTSSVLRPTQPPTLSGTGNEQQLQLRGEGLVWLIGAIVCLLAAPWVQLFVSAGNKWPHNALRNHYHWLMPISCDFRDCKALLVTSLTHVSGTIASVQTFTFNFTTGLL